MLLYSYFRSSSAYRVRIALNLKGITYEVAPVNLVKHEQRDPDYLATNAQGLVPTLVTGEGTAISQSSAILEWLEEQYPQAPLYPPTAEARARIRSFCQHIACEIQPLNNLRVLNYLRETLGLDEDAVSAWYAHWVAGGFASAELQARAGGAFVGGDAPGMAEVFLVPQVYNALRFNVPMTDFPRLLANYERCNELEAFAHAHPDAQPDTPVA